MGRWLLPGLAWLCCAWAWAAPPDGGVVQLREAQALLQPDGRPAVERTVALTHRWDADFPDVLRQAGAQEVDLLFVPSNDWYELRDIHAGMATFRAVENGMAIFRQTGAGVSLVADAYGRILNRVDSFAAAPTGAVTDQQQVATPVGSVATLYPLAGDAFGWIMQIGLVGLVVFLWIKRRR